MPNVDGFVKINGGEGQRKDAAGGGCARAVSFDACGIAANNR